MNTPMTREDKAIIAAETEELARCVRSVEHVASEIGRHRNSDHKQTADAFNLCLHMVAQLMARAELLEEAWERAAVAGTWERALIDSGVIERAEVNRLKRGLAPRSN